MTAGPCLCAAYEESNILLVVVLLNCKSLEARWREAEALIEWGYKKVNTDK